MKKETIYQLVASIVLAVALCIVGLFNLHIAGTSVALTSLVIYVGAFLVGPYWSLLSVAIYILVGIAGLPVFAGGISGLAFITGNLGFFPIGLFFLAFISGVYVRNTRANIWKVAIAMVVATVMFYLVGMLRWVWVERSYMNVAFTALVKNQIVFDVVRIVLGIAIGKPLRSLLVKAGLIVEVPETEKKSKKAE